MARKDYKSARKAAATVEEENRLVKAIRSGKINLVESIVSVQDDLVEKRFGKYDILPIQVAAHLGDSEILQILLQHGARVNAKDRLNRTALFQAASAGRVRCAEVLLNSDARVNDMCGRPDVPYSSPNQRRLDFLRGPTFDSLIRAPECGQRTPLHEAARGLHVECVELLVAHGAQYDARDVDGVTPLSLAGVGVHAGEKDRVRRYEEIVCVLLGKGANPNCFDARSEVYPLHTAVSLLSEKVVRKLIERGAKVNVRGHGLKTPMHLAAALGVDDLVHALMTSPDIVAVINQRDADGDTPVKVAAVNGRYKILQQLIPKGADLSMKDSSGMTFADVIFNYVPRPVKLFDHVFNGCFDCNDLPIRHKAFCVTLDFSVLVPDTHKANQMTVIQAIISSNCKEDASIVMKHPLVMSFLYLKWRKLKYCFFTFFSLYLLYVLAYSSYVFLQFYDLKGNSTTHARQLFMNDRTLESTAMAARVITNVSISFIFLYASMLLVFFPAFYLKEFEPWVFLCTSSLALTTVNSGFRVEGREWVAHTAAVSVLLAWLELMYLLGRFPKLGYYSLVFCTVVKNMLRVLMTFLCLILGFSFSFFILFVDQEDFKDPYRSFVKTVVMTMGEFEYTHVFEHQGTYVRLTSRIIFVLFILLASMVLVNLMVGIAVCDVSRLRDVAQVRMLSKQAYFLTHLEKMATHPCFSRFFPKCLRERIKRYSTVPLQVAMWPSDANRRKNLPEDIEKSIMASILKMRLEIITGKSSSDLSEEIFRSGDESELFFGVANVDGPSLQSGDQLEVMLKTLIDNIQDIHTIIGEYLVVPENEEREQLNDILEDIDARLDRKIATTMKELKRTKLLVSKMGLGRMELLD